MLEKDIENLIASYPEEFFPGEGFKLIGQQVLMGNRRADVVFKDKFERTIIIEVKRGILNRDAAGQIIEYYGLLKNENPNDVIELILCANTIPYERRQFLGNVGIECKEIGCPFIESIAKKYNYRFLDSEVQGEGKKNTNISILNDNGAIKEDVSRVWIFQANPKKYRIMDDLSDPDLKQYGWTINQYKDEIKTGDIALIWISGEKAGVYAIAEVSSDPYDYIPNPEEETGWINEEDRDKKRTVVDIVLTKKMVNNPALRNNIREVDGLKNLSILKMPQGTNFRVTEDEWNILKDLLK